MTITPKEAMRLSHAAALADKHGDVLVAPDGATQMGWAFDAPAVAALIDEANATKDATITRLRTELQEAYKEETRAARDSYAQGQQDEADRHNNDGY